MNIALNLPMSVLEQGSTYGIQLPAPVESAALSLHAPRETLPLHQHRGAYVCVVLAGAFTETAGSGEAQRRTGDIVLHPAGARHADRFEASGGLCLNLHTASDAIERPAVRRATAAFRAAAESLSVGSALGHAGDRLSAESALADMLDILFNPELAKSPAPVDRVIEALDDEPQREWTLDQLALIAGRHPTHLARAFREATGVSIGQYRRRRRVLNLALALRCTREPLAHLAQTHGYADQAHMTREFRRVAACTPADWRRQLR